jgi:hypothetical protein
MEEKKTKKKFFHKFSKSRLFDFEDSQNPETGGYNKIKEFPNTGFCLTQRNGLNPKP